MTRSPPSSPRHEATPLVTELELESAILRGVSNRRPVGQHKHILMISLQADVHEETGIWVPVPNLWEQLRKMYDLEALDSMSSTTPSLPSSPEPLSPIPRPKRRRPRAGSLSSLSSPSPSPPPERTPSRSAAVIDSEHFDDVFWLPGTVPPDCLKSGRATLSGGYDLATPIDTDDEDFHELLYSRAVGEDEEEQWEAGVKAQMARNESKVTSTTSKKGRGGKPNSGGTASGSRRASGGEPDTSPLSSDTEAPAPKKSRGRPRGSTKRGRESVGDTDEEERPVGRRRRR